MGHSQANKAATHQRIVETAARLFRENGIDRVSVSDLMKEAGLTHGGFYKHFESRDELVAEAVDEALRHSRTTLDRLRSEQPASLYEAFVDEYLGRTHRDSPGNGCAITALVGDVARNDPRARSLYTTQIERNLQVLGSMLAVDPASEEGQSDAIIALSLMVGALGLARAVADEALSDRILDAAKRYLKNELTA